MDRAFAPEWAGGWTLARWGFAFAALWGHLPRLSRIDDAYACTDMLFNYGPYRLNEWVTFTPLTATVLWVLGLLGIVAIAVGGRLFRPGMLFYLVGAWALLAEESINIKAHDRLSLWVAVGLLLSPAHERSLTTKWRSPVGRWFLLVVFGWLYWSTGSLKAMEEPGWFNGSALQYHFLHRFHAGGELAVWMSTQNAICRVLGWFTVAFEVGFPLLVLWRRANPWVLLAGMGFHLGILALMNVGAFSFVALSAYPAMLHPEVARGLWQRLRPLLSRLPAAGVLGLVACGAEPARPPEPTQNLLLVYIDTLRADHLGAYGYPLPTSPTIDALAATGARLDAAYAPAPWTLVSTASLFTGLLPATHGAGIPGSVRNEARATTVTQLSGRFTTLADVAESHGFATALFARNSYLGHGVEQGFSTVSNPRRRDGAHTVDAALEWLDDVPDDDRFFLAVHLMDAHTPNDPPAEHRAHFPALVEASEGQLKQARRFRREFGDADYDADEIFYRQRRQALYDASIRYVDEQVGRLLEGLGDRRRDTLVVVTADHGEEFWDHYELEQRVYEDPRRQWGMGHGHTFFEELVRVPMIFAQPGVLIPSVVSARVSHVDWMPTVLDLLGLDGPDDIDGQSYAALLQGGKAPAPDPTLVFDEVCFGADKQGIREGDLKLVRSVTEADLLLDLSADPGETRNLAAQRPADVARLGAELDRRLAAAAARGQRLLGGTTPEDRALDDDEIDELRAMGYLDDDAE